MGFVSVTELKTANGSKFWGGSRRHGADIVIATHVSRATKPALAITISLQIAKKARLIAGDRVEIFFDEQSAPRRCLIKRVSEGGLCVSGRGPKEKRLGIKVTWIKGIPSVDKPYDCQAVVTDDGILFDIPDEASFDKAMRAYN